MTSGDKDDHAPEESSVGSGGNAFPTPDLRDEFFMGFALAEASAARDEGEVPIGAVIVRDGTIIGRGHNRPIGLKDPTAHAEILALREAAGTLGNYRLLDATMYVTIEPCSMCAGALVNARIRRVVFGAPDVRAGALQSVFAICSNSSLNHQVEVSAGICADAAKEYMQSFFRARRGISARLTGEAVDNSERCESG